MHRNSNADMTPLRSVRDTASIDPDAAGVHRSSLPDEPTQTPDSHSSCAIVAVALGGGSGVTGIGSDVRRYSVPTDRGADCGPSCIAASTTSASGVSRRKTRRTFSLATAEPPGATDPTC